MQLLIILYFLVVIVLFLLSYFRERITPVTIFIFAQGLFFTGMLKFLDYRNENDLLIVIIYLIGIICFGIGAAIGRLKHRIDLRSVTFVKEPLKKRQYLLIRVLIGFSAILFLYFCYATRLSTISIMFSNLFGKSELDITESRINSYNVLGTSVIYAFRISILPVLVVTLVKREHRVNVFVKFLLVLFMVFFSLITGQRGGFVYVMLMWLLSIVLVIFYKKSNRDIRIGAQRRKVVIIFSALVIIFLFMSVINGRVSGSLFGEIVQRFFSDNQRTAYHAFHYIFAQGPCWGRNYFEEIVNLIVPGDRYTPLSKIIFSIMYGSTRGTAPACLWGSVFYNFSWLGIVLFGIIYGYFCHYIGFRFYSRKINSLRCAIYSYMFIDLGMLLAGGPFQLFNNGFVPLIILAYLLHVDKDSERV